MPISIPHLPQERKPGRSASVGVVIMREVARRAQRLARHLLQTRDARLQLAPGTAGARHGRQFQPQRGRARTQRVARGAVLRRQFVQLHALPPKTFDFRKIFVDKHSRFCYDT